MAKENLENDDDKFEEEVEKEDRKNSKTAK